MQHVDESGYPETIRNLKPLYEQPSFLIPVCWPELHMKFCIFKMVHRHCFWHSIIFLYLCWKGWMEHHCDQRILRENLLQSNRPSVSSREWFIMNWKLGGIHHVKAPIQLITTTRRYKQAAYGVYMTTLWHEMLPVSLALSDGVSLMTSGFPCPVDPPYSRAVIQSFSRCSRSGGDLRCHGIRVTSLQWIISALIVP